MKKLVLGLILVFCVAAPIASQAQVIVDIHHRHHHHRRHHHPYREQ